MDAQVKRGILEICVLRILGEEDSYGYKIIKDISPYVEISESALYPILRRLETAKMLEAYSVEHKGRLRKYYRITKSGVEKIEDFILEWRRVVTAYNFITGKKEV